MPHGRRYKDLYEYAQTDPAAAGEGTGCTEEAKAAADAQAMASDVDDDTLEVCLQNVTPADQLLRALADAENMRRRTERELETARKYGHTGFARDLVGAIDNLALALEAAPGI